MTSRRSFFRRIAATVAIVALAPEIAFGKLPATVKPPAELDRVPWRVGDDLDPFYIETMSTYAPGSAVAREYSELRSGISFLVGSRAEIVPMRERLVDAYVRYYKAHGWRLR